jgi:hypothetical protein
MVFAGMVLLRESARNTLRQIPADLGSKYHLERLWQSLSKLQVSFAPRNIKQTTAFLGCEEADLSAGACIYLQEEQQVILLR